MLLAGDIGGTKTDLAIFSPEAGPRASLAEAGNLALRVLATGGVYLGGGIPPRILPAPRQERFLGAFWGKARMSDLLVRVPVHVILNPKVALLGAACRGLELEFKKPYELTDGSDPEAGGGFPYGDRKRLRSLLSFTR